MLKTTVLHEDIQCCRWSYCLKLELNSIVLFAALQNAAEVGEKRFTHAYATFLSSVIKWQRGWLRIMVWERILLILAGKAWASWPHWVLHEDTERTGRGAKARKAPGCPSCVLCPTRSHCQVTALWNSAPAGSPEHRHTSKPVGDTPHPSPSRKRMRAAHGTLGQGMGCS